MKKYGVKSRKTVKTAVHKMKRGKLKSGRSGKTVKNRKQAIAIGLSEARKKGAKVPKKRTTSSRKRTTSSASARKRTASTAKRRSTASSRKRTAARRAA